MMAKRKRPQTTPTHPEPTPRVDGVRWGEPSVLEAVAWDLPGAIPRGAPILLEGRKGTGKTSIAAAIAACVTGGPPIPGWTGPRGARVLWQASEEDFCRIVQPRLIAAGAVVERCGTVDVDAGFGRRRRLILPDDLVLLGDILRETECQLLVLDPYVSLAGAGINVCVEQSARAYLEPLAETCSSRGVTCVWIRHLKKGSSGDIRDAGLGSTAVANVSRAILRCDDHPHTPGQFTLAVVASNFGARRSTQIYEIIPGSADWPRIQWCGDSILEAEEIAEGRGSESERDEWHDADQLLATALSSGWQRVSVLQTEGERGGISLRTLRRAKARLKVRSRRRQLGSEGYWEWGAPIDGFPDGLATYGENDPQVPDQGGQGGHVHAHGHLGHVAPDAEPEKPRKSRRGKRVTSNSNGEELNRE